MKLLVFPVFSCGFFPSVTFLPHFKLCLSNKEVTEAANHPKSSWNVLLPVPAKLHLQHITYNVGGVIIG